MFDQTLISYLCLYLFSSPFFLGNVSILWEETSQFLLLRIISASGSLFFGFDSLRIDHAHFEMYSWPVILAFSNNLKICHFLELVSFSA